MDNKLKYEIDTSFQNYITVENLIKIRAERKTGEMIPEQITVGTKSHDATLSDLDIERMQSICWQNIASIPEETFEEHRLNTKLVLQAS